MSCKSEDFPTPASPTTRMVCGGVAVSFDVLTIPFLRDCASLGNGVRVAASASKASVKLT